MRKLSLILFGLLISFMSFGQNQPPNQIIIVNRYNSIQTSVERELNYAADLYSSAATAYILGTGLVLTSYYLDKLSGDPGGIQDRQQTKDILYGVGGGMIVIGAICQLSAGIHLKTAGMLIDIQTNQDGVGVKLKLNK